MCHAAASRPIIDHTRSRGRGGGGGRGRGARGPPASLTQPGEVAAQQTNAASSHSGAVQMLLVAAARRTAIVGRSAPVAVAAATPQFAVARAAARRRAASSVACRSEDGTELAAKASTEPPVAPKAASEPMDPVEFRRQQEAAGYVMGRKKRLRAPLSDYAPPGSSHALAFQPGGPGVRDDEILVAGRNASEKESDETHTRFESVLSTFACIAFAIWVAVSFNDIKSAITGEYEQEIQTQLPVRTSPLWPLLSPSDHLLASC